MREFKTIRGFKALLIGLSALLPLATFSGAQEVDSQVGKPVRGVDRTVKAAVHDEVTGQPSVEMSNRPRVPEAGSKWGPSDNLATSGKPLLKKSASSNPNEHLSKTPTRQAEPMFMPNAAPNGKPAGNDSSLAQGAPKHAIPVSSAVASDSQRAVNAGQHTIHGGKPAGRASATPRNGKSHKAMAKTGIGHEHDRTKARRKKSISGL